MPHRAVRSRPSSADSARGWGSFPDTVLHFRTQAPFDIDLRERVGSLERSELSAIGLERSFGVVTADDPMGREHSAAENANRAASLQQEIAGLTRAYARVEACSPDGSHCEHSIAVKLDERTLIDIARRYEQLAVFWFDGEAFWLVPVYSTNARLRLPLFVSNQR